MSKRVVSLLLALVLGVSLSLPVSAASAYSDVPEGHWAAGYVGEAARLGIFQGIGGGRFGAGQPITRGAFVTALVRLFRWEEVSPDRGSYADVPQDKWYYTAVETARANGALATTGRTFRPDANITREEMAAMLVRGLGYASLAGTLSGEKSPFTDVKTNRGFITVAYDLGIVSGVGGGLFAPGSTATREQAAAMMVRVSRRLYAGDRRVESVGDRTALRVPTPAATEEQSMPTTPLEPLPALYQELHRLKSRGVDMSRVVLCLSGGGVRTVTSGGRILQTDELTAREVSELLEQPGVRTYYSDRYESAYCISQTNGYQTATLWYQSGESMAAKLQLARLFGVTSYILEEPERPDSGK